MYAIKLLEIPVGKKIAVLAAFREHWRKGLYGTDLKEAVNMVNAGVLTIPTGTEVGSHLEELYFKSLAAKLCALGAHVALLKNWLPYTPAEDITHCSVAPCDDDVLAGVPQRRQRQDSTIDQIKDLILVANRLGMYDAADSIKERYNL